MQEVHSSQLIVRLNNSSGTGHLRQRGKRKISRGPLYGALNCPQLSVLANAMPRIHYNQLLLPRVPLICY